MEGLKWVRVAIVSVPFFRVLLHLSDAVDERQKRRGEGREKPPRAE